ncbi:MAG: Rqc2 family fibronectin-binding protein, partial [Christensenellales bacterium]
MTLDGLTLHFIVNEIREQALGCKVDKIHQPQPDTLILNLRATRNNIRLLICAGAADSRMHITAHKFENPKSPPMFCMFLRKYITGAKIAKIEQIELERIVNITLEARDELGLPLELTLVAELMGKYSNVILKDSSDTIMDSLRHVTRSLSRVRCVLPSLKYESLQSTKLNPMTVSEATLIEMLKKHGSRKIKDYLSYILQGVSGQTANEILYRYMPSGYAPQPKEAEKIADQISIFFAGLSRPQPTMYLDKDGTPLSYSPVEYHSIVSDSTEKFGSINELADDYYHRLKE